MVSVYLCDFIEVTHWRPFTEGLADSIFALSLTLIKDFNTSTRENVQENVALMPLLLDTPSIHSQHRFTSISENSSC